MKEYLPYIVSIVSALIAAIVSIAVSKNQTKTEIKKIQEQTKATLEIEREKLQLEKEKMELEHKLELEKLNAQNGNEIATELIKTVIQTPEAKAQLSQGMRSGMKKQKRK